MRSARRCSTSSRVIWSRCVSWVYSKYETNTPPALHKMSGMMKTPLAVRISSAFGVSGALAPSAIIRARMRGAFCFRNHRPGGGRNEHVAIGLNHAFGGNLAAAGKPLDVARLADVLGQAINVEAVGMKDAAGKIGDGDHRGAAIGDRLRRHAADIAKTLHRPRNPDNRRFSRSQAARIVAATPLPVASRRPTMPPSTTGLPVT